MKVRMSFSCIGLSIKETEGKDGKKFHQISIDQEGEAGTLPITEDCYRSLAGTFKKYSPCSITAEWNDQYKYMRVIAVSQR